MVYEYGDSFSNLPEGYGMDDPIHCDGKNQKDGSPCTFNGTGRELFEYEDKGHIGRCPTCMGENFSPGLNNVENKKGHKIYSKEELEKLSSSELIKYINKIKNLIKSNSYKGTETSHEDDELDVSLGEALALRKNIKIG